jgi:hypothetical protein
VATTITVADIQPDMNHYVEVKLIVSNKWGGCTVPLKFADQGGRAENEKQAHKELRLWLQETLEFLESRPDLWRSESV